MLRLAGGRSHWQRSQVVPHCLMVPLRTCSPDWHNMFQLGQYNKPWLWLFASHPTELLSARHGNLGWLLEGETVNSLCVRSMRIGTLWLTSIIQVLFCLIIHKKQHEAFEVEKCTQCGLNGFTKYPGSMLQSISITHVQDEMCESSSRLCCCNLSKKHHNHQESLATGIISNFSMKFHFCTSSSLELVKDSNICEYKVLIFCTCSILRAAWPSLPTTDWEQELSWYMSTTLCSTRIWDTNFDHPKHEKHPHKITRSSELIFILLEMGSKYAASMQAPHSSSILCAWVLKMSQQSLANNTAGNFASINCWFSLEHARRFLNVDVHFIGQNKFNLWILLQYLQVSETRIC